MFDKQSIFNIWMVQILGYGTSLHKELIEMFGSAKDVFERGKDELNFGEMAQKHKQAFEEQDLSKAKEIYNRCVKEDVGILTLEDDDYPEYLKETPNPPGVLYYKGNINRLKNVLITIVGTRHPDFDGKKIANIFSDSLVNSGLQIVSGFAPGIEATIHKNIKSTIAVLPNGINLTYPTTHWRLKNDILANDGLILTEFHFDLRALKSNFIHRNRILAGLSPATLVIQAPQRSGTSITVNAAGNYGRDTYVIPGSIFSPVYEWSLRFIREGSILVTNPSDIIYDYMVKFPDLIKSKQIEEIEMSSGKTINLEKDDYMWLDDTEKAVLSVISGNILHINEVAAKSNISVATASAVLTNLEILGIVEKNVGNKFSIK